MNHLNPEIRHRHTIMACALSFVMATLAHGQASSQETPLNFTYSLHSTLGLLRMETPVTVTAEAVETVELRVPNRGFTAPQRYSGDGRFSYRLIGEAGEIWPPVDFRASADWNGHHVYFFVFRNPGGEFPVRFAPMPENPKYRGRGAVVFGNYSDVPIAARLGTDEIRTMPGKTFWRDATEAPEGMETLLVKAEGDRIRPIYRNRIPIREDQRLFIFVVPGPAEGREKLMVVYDRDPGASLELRTEDE